ncbi:MAG: hypothetical protein AB1568_03135 [Thermodesulfobacteriota bacterium]
MSGIYLLGVIAIWLWLTRLLWKTGRRFLDASFANRPTRLMLVAVIGALWFGGSFWEAGGKKLYWDARVRELCAKDGGVRVYETVELPAEMFDKWGMVNFYRPTQRERALGNDYLLKSETIVIRDDNPKIWREQYQLYRSIDGSLLGVAVSYSRLGGDLPGPWQESSFGCPQAAGDASLIREIFTIKK